jgi:hypothetical protein
MTEAAQGPGWWQASDGHWYPPESHPGAGSYYAVGAPGAGSLILNILWLVLSGFWLALLLRPVRGRFGLLRAWGVGAVP